MDIRALPPSSLGRVYRYKVGKTGKALLRSPIQIRKGKKARVGGKMFGSWGFGGLGGLGVGGFGVWGFWGLGGGVGVRGKLERK